MSARYSTVRSDRVDYGFWLIFDDNGGVRLSRGRTAIRRNERAMSCTATLPLALFRTPALHATFTVDGGAARFDIDVKAAEEALRHALGVDVDLQIRQSDA